MTTLAELVDQPPAASHGITAPITGGLWVFAVELADPSAGSSVEWFDVTQWVVGFDTERGADWPFGQARAATATIDIAANDDMFAPWNEDTSDTFGVHVKLGAGLLMRAGAFRLVGESVVEWVPIFTQEVESWGDATYALGEIRVHRVVCTDTISSLVNVPVGVTDEGEGWFDRAETVLGWGEWAYGHQIYGAVQWDDSGMTDVLPLPARDEQSSAINELDVTFDPAGIVWRTNRRGQLIAHPMPGDVFHQDLFDNHSATGAQYTDPLPVVFAWNATETGGAVAYEAEGSSPFGFEDDVRGVLNHVHLTYPAGSYDNDSPTSIERFRRKTYSASWIAENDTVGDQILNGHAFASMQAKPLSTSLELAGFFPTVPILDITHPVTIVHATAPDRVTVSANGRVQSIRESWTAAGFQWTAQIQVDIEQYGTELSLLPVEDLAIDSLEAPWAGFTEFDSLAVTFTWTNPGGQPVEPTETWVRLRPNSLIWVELDYPMTEMTWEGLEPNTSYEFDVRLVRRVDGIVTNASPIRTVTFTTGEIPDVEEGCEIEWELQSSADGETWVLEDSGTTETTIPDPDPEMMEGERWWRIRWREDCGEGPGDWVITPIAIGSCSDSPALEEDPFDDLDLVLFLLSACPPDRVIEAVTQTEATHGPAYGGIDEDINGNFVLLSAPDAAPGGVVYGTSDNLVGLTGDQTIQCEVNLATQVTTRLFQAGAIWISAQLWGDGWRPSATVATPAGEAVVTGDELDLETTYVVRATYDAAVSGELKLYVDDVEVGDTAFGEPQPTVNALPIYRVALPA